MDGGSHCSICFSEYTINGNHRVVSLKCGHLFGLECIEKWLSVYKRKYCPACSLPCRKTHFRLIFAAKVEATDSEKDKETIEKYLKEINLRKTLESEILKLKSQIDILKSSLKQQNAVLKVENSKIHMNFLKYHKIHFFPDQSIVHFDSINQSVVISCRKNGSFGLFKYNLLDFSINSFIKFENNIKNFNLSPFNDGLCLVASGITVSLLNIYTENVIRSLSFNFTVTFACFSSSIRGLIFVSDLSGNLHIIDIADGINITVKVCNSNIHGIVETNEQVYIASAFEIYYFDIKSYINPNINKLDIEKPGICCNITTNGRLALINFRDSNFEITGTLLGEKYIVFNPEIKQLFKHSDCVFNGYVLVTDDNKNTIKVLDLNTLQMVYLYTFKEPIVGFCGDSKVLIVLTRRGVYLYN